MMMMMMRSSAYGVECCRSDLDPPSRAVFQLTVVVTVINTEEACDVDFCKSGVGY